MLAKSVMTFLKTLNCCRLRSHSRCKSFTCSNCCSCSEMSGSFTLNGADADVTREHEQIKDRPPPPPPAQSTGVTAL